MNIVTVEYNSGDASKIYYPKVKSEILLGSWEGKKAFWDGQLSGGACFNFRLSYVIYNTESQEVWIEDVYTKENIMKPARIVNA